MLGLHGAGICLSGDWAALEHLVGIVVVGLALWVEFAFSPPIWLHLVLWSALSIILSLALVRPSKGALVALQYRHKAEEGRIQK